MNWACRGRKYAANLVSLSKRSTAGKKQYFGLEPDEARELKQLPEENGKFKRLVADLSLDKAMLQDITTKKVVSDALQYAIFVNTIKSVFSPLAGDSKQTYL